jgi:eukaryotic-like serine/threonine-protein kinase
MTALSQNDSPQVIGKYTLIEKLGEGCLGPVYRSLDPDLSQAAVIRILCDGIKWDDQVEEHLRGEGKSITALRHQNIASVFEFGKEGQYRYVATESLGANNLESLITRRQKISVEAKLSIMVQIVEGLSYAHKNGVLHYNLRPGKIHLAPGGSIKIRDFALARILLKYLPHPCVRWGAPIYWSPEQIRHQKSDARSDIFSAGLIFYELLTGLHPFHDKDGNRALDNILQNTHIPTFDQFPDAPPGVWAVLKTCMAKDPKERYQTADELLEACRELLRDMAEDTQLMLGELQASLGALKKVAAQPDASEETIQFVQAVQKVLRGEKEADYAGLDRMVSQLIDCYPMVQTAAADLPGLEQVYAPIPPNAGPEPPPQPVVSEAQPDPIPATPLPQPPPEEALETAESVGRSISSGKEPARSVPDMLPEDLRPEPAPVPEQMDEPIPVPEFSPDPVQASPDDSQQPDRISNTVPRYRRIRRPSYRIAAVLLALLLIAAAAYIFVSTSLAASICIAWNTYIPPSITAVNAFVSHPWPGFNKKLKESESGGLQESAKPKNDLDIKEASGLKQAAESEGTPQGKSPSPVPQTQIAGVTALIGSGKLQLARSEIDRLRQAYPGAPEIQALQRQWQSENSRQEQALRRDEQLRTVKKEDGWNRQFEELFAGGKYNEAAGALSLWLADNPGSVQAQDFSVKLNEIQRGLRLCNAAVSESRYQEALNVLGGLERINPSDQGFSEIRREIEAKRAAAKGILTVHRLGAKAEILLDGKPLGTEGEVANEMVPIGIHAITIGNDAGPIVSRNQEFLENQRVSLIYDAAKLILRPMVESDRDLLLRRNAMEEVHRFVVEHEHGAFRRACRGVLLVTFYDVTFRPSSGEHGFRIPFKHLKARVNGKIVELYLVSDNEPLHNFKISDTQTGDQFRQVWNDLKALAPQ